MARILIFLLCLILSACGGGSSSGPDSSASSGSVSGVAATGSAIAGRIYLKDAAGHELYMDTADGNYSFQTAGLTPPFMLKAEWTTGNTIQRLYSFSSSGGIANITPLTHMVVVVAAGTDALDTVYAAPSTQSFVTISNALPVAISDMQQSLAPLLAKNSVSGTNPITGAFIPDHTGMDAVLDSITVSYSTGSVTVADKVTGAIILDGMTDDLSRATSAADWSPQDAAVASAPDVAVDGNGKGLAVWTQSVGSRLELRGRFLTGTDAAITLSNSGDAGAPRVVLDALGNALVVWTQYENNRNDIWVRRYIASSMSWTSPLRLSAPNAVTHSSVPNVGVDALGNAIVTWYQGDGRANHYDVWAVQYNAAQNAWNSPSLVSDGVNSAYLSRVAVNAAGQGIIVWQQDQGDGSVSNGPKDIWGRKVTTNGVWGSGTKLNAVGGNVDTVYGQAAVAVDHLGNGLALWVQRSGSMPFVIHAAKYASGSGWQASAVITNNAVDNCYSPQLAFDGAGNAVAVWMQQANEAQYGGTNRFVAGSGWGTSGSFSSGASDLVYDPRVAVDAEGNATAIWYQIEQSGVNVRINRYVAGSGWGMPFILSATSTNGTYSYPVPRVAANAAGQTVAIWGIDSY